MRGLVVAGMASGVGKTTVACALMAAFRRRGDRVQPFKAGPDYIDPSHHALAAGAPSRNLDTVLVPPAVVQQLFRRVAARADIAIIEGVMGLFDGRSGADDEGSTAQIAKLLGAPVVVVIDASRIARTAGAMALGCIDFDPEVNVVGFILNRVGSPGHAQTAAAAIETATGRRVFGAIPRDSLIQIPERHLGLVPTNEKAPARDFLERLADRAERHLDLDALWDAAAHLRQTVADDEVIEEAAVFEPGHARIAVARDRAFSFYYEDSLELLEAAGAELVSFSPLADGSLPAGTQGIYIGGGFPELFAAELSANTAMRSALRRAAERGMPIYGECGGLMYLGQALTDFEGRQHTMAGVAPMRSVMQRDHVSLGYRTARALRSSPILQAGEQVMGHEFHYSVPSAPVKEATAAYSLGERGDACEGYAQGNVLASYVHVHFGADPRLARRFVARCATTPE